MTCHCVLSGKTSKDMMCELFISESDFVLNFEPFGDVMSSQKDDKGQHIMLYNFPHLTKSDEDAEEHRDHKTRFIVDCTHVLDGWIVVLNIMKVAKETTRSCL